MKRLIRVKILFGIQNLCVPSGWFFEEHQHPGIEITGVLKSSVTLGASNQVWYAEAGQIFVLPPYLPHHWFTEEGAALAVIHLDEVPKEFTDSLLSGSQPRILKLSHPVFTEYCSLFARIDAMSSQITPRQHRLLRAYLEVLLLVLLEADQCQDDAITGTMHDAVLYMQSHIGEPLSMADVARVFYMSETTFRRHFQAVFEMTPKHYLLELRLTKAQDLLTTTHLSIQEIAESAGFFDQAHFSSTFRRRFGLPPSAWRHRSYL